MFGKSRRLPNASISGTSPMNRFAAASLLVLAGASAANAADLSVRVTGLSTRNGNLAVCLWEDGRSFPDCSRSSSAQRLVVPASAAAKPIVFRGLKPGTYAVSVIHDENGDGRLNTNFLGIPQEGYGVSNNAAPRFSAPRFKASAFAVKGDTTQSIRLVYF